MARPRVEDRGCCAIAIDAGLATFLFAEGRLNDRFERSRTVSGKAFALFRRLTASSKCVW